MPQESHYCNPLFVFEGKTFLKFDFQLLSFLYIFCRALQLESGVLSSTLDHGPHLVEAGRLGQGFLLWRKSRRALPRGMRDAVLLWIVDRFPKCNQCTTGANTLMERGLRKKLSIVRESCGKSGFDVLYVIHSFSLPTSLSHFVFVAQMS